MKRSKALKAHNMIAQGSAPGNPAPQIPEPCKGETSANFKSQISNLKSTETLIWRDAAKDLPEMETKVLLFSKEPEPCVDMGYYGPFRFENGTEEIGFYDTDDNLIDKPITHWAPMPVGPKG